MVEKGILFKFIDVEVHLPFTNLGGNNASDEEISFDNSLEELSLVLEDLRFHIALVFDLMLSMFFNVEIVEKRVKILPVFTCFNEMRDRSFERVKEWTFH